MFSIDVYSGVVARQNTEPLQCVGWDGCIPVGRGQTTIMAYAYFKSDGPRWEMWGLVTVDSERPHEFKGHWSLE